MTYHPGHPNGRRLNPREYREWAAQPNYTGPLMERREFTPEELHEEIYGKPEPLKYAGWWAVWQAVAEALGPWFEERLWRRRYRKWVRAAAVESFELAGDCCQLRWLTVAYDAGRRLGLNDAAVDRDVSKVRRRIRERSRRRRQVRV